PIVKQNEAIRAYLRSRRAIRDVDPETGEETTEEVPDIRCPLLGSGAAPPTDETPTEPPT
ncbi:unnamed protein product, partial [marine sediment metagenome]